MNWRTRLRALFRKENLDADMAEEMRTHLEMETARHVARGLSPDEARYAAQREFGGVEQIKERARDQRGWRWVEHFAQDLRYAFRTLRKTPGFTLVVVVSLALGIGANALFFGVLDRMLLRPLAARRPGELVRFQWQTSPTWTGPRDMFEDAPWLDASNGRPTGSAFSQATFEQFRTQAAPLGEVFAFGANSSRLVVSLDGRSETAWGQLVSGNYHRALGLVALQGRILLPEDEGSGAAPVAVISRRCWQKIFNGDPAMVGKTVWLNHTAVTVVGIMPDSAGDPLTAGQDPRDFTLPLTLLLPMDPRYGATKTRPATWWLRIMARLHDGVTTAQTAAALEGVFQQTHREGLKKESEPLSLRVVPGGRGFVEARQAYAADLNLPITLGILVLAVACANVATLLLARGSARRREIAVRLALGAGRSRIVRQLITESVLLALLGAAAGLLVAEWGGAALGLDEAWQVEWRVLGFTTGLALLTAVMFGLVPALRATRVDLTAEFQGGARTLGRDGRSWLGQSLVVGQVALSCVLLVLSGLLVRTLHNLRTLDTKFDRSHLLLVTVDATFAGYKATQTPALFGRLAENLAGLPGVQSATFSTFGQLSGGFWTRGFRRESETPPGVDNVARVQEVAPNYFTTHEIALLAGRGFTAHDLRGGQRVVIINERAAKLFFGEQNPIGQRASQMDGRPEIVGVVRDAKLGELRSNSPVAYLPFAQSAQEFATFTIRTAGEPGALAASVRKATAAIDQNLLITDLRTQDEQIESLLVGERFFARIAVAFGVLALALACVGLYGLMSYAVVRRTSEIGIRMALGALPGGVLWMIVRESLALTLIGLVVGLAGAVAAVRLVANLLYGLSPTDPATYGAVALVLIAVASLAAFLPARRASKVDPMVALRCE